MEVKFSSNVDINDALADTDSSLYKGQIFLISMGTKDMSSLCHGRPAAPGRPRPEGGGGAGRGPHRYQF